MSDALPPARAYQTTGRSWLWERLTNGAKAVLLADDAGLGKTRQALGAAYDLKAENILILCPAGARRVWQQEIARWLPQWSRRVFLVEPGVTGTKVLFRMSLPPVILVISYDEMSRVESRLPAALAQMKWDLGIFDEAHYLKNPSNRTIAVYGPRGDAAGIQAACAKVILLTGTPTPNHAGELYQHYRTFWPATMLVPNRGAKPGAPSQRALTQVEFEDRFTRYRDTVYGRQITGSKNQAELRDALGAVVLRRRKDEVLPELPPLIVQDVPLAEVRDWRDQLGANSVSLAVRLDQSATRATTDDQFIAALNASATNNQSGASLRRQLGELKVGPAAEWIAERLNSAEKILVFAWHISVLEHLHRRLAQFDPVLVTGATNPTGRVTAIDQFQHRRNVRVFLGQILACGTAITLTAANEVAIVEPSWVPGENVQAICRAHRLGQRDSVLASFLYLPDTLDERIMRTFRRKAAEISELHDPKDDQTHESPGTGQRDIRSGGHDRSGRGDGPHRPAVQGGGDHADSGPGSPGGPHQSA